MKSKKVLDFELGIVKLKVISQKAIKKREGKNKKKKTSIRDFKRNIA